MSERTIIVHDATVYSALKKQTKINRRFTAFAVIAGIYIFMLTKELKEQGKKLRELDPKVDKEEDAGIQINI